MDASNSRSGPCGPVPQPSGGGADPDGPAVRHPRRATVLAAAMAGLLLALVLLLAGLFVWQGQRDARLAAETRAASAAFNASSYVRWLVEANLQTVERVADSIARRPELFQAFSSNDLNDTVASLPGSVFIWVFDAKGNSILSNEPSIGPLNIAGEECFKVLRAGAPWHIGQLMGNRHAGLQVFPITRRIERDGEFLGAVVIYVPADLLARFWASMEIGPGSTVGLLREDGPLVARHPVPEKPLNLADYILFTKYLPEAPEGVYEAEASPADGVPRLVGYQRVAGLPLVTAVGIPMTTLGGALWRRIGEIALLTLPIGFALLGVSLFTVRLLHREEQARHALADALDRNRTLLREIHHRVKNNLQTVAALIQLQPGPDQAKKEVMNRIAAMTAVHEHMYRNDQFARVDIAGYIRTLVASLRAGYGTAVTIDCTLESIVVDADRATPLGLIVNEAVTNAVKHAFPDGREGVITVTLAAADGRAVLTVQDNGIGCSPDAGNPTGMGSRLIRGLSKQIGGRHEITCRNGTRFVLEFPVL